MSKTRSAWKRPERGAPARRGGFTLIELLVSIAVLTLALSVVGVVFRTTTRATSQAGAHAEALSAVRQWMQEIERDLEACDPASSILVMIGRTQPAALTADGLEAGLYYRELIGDPSDVPPDYDPKLNPALNSEYSEPRRDILAFFSQRPTASIAPPLEPGPDEEFLASGGKYDQIFVVYGHAALAEPEWDDDDQQFEYTERVPPRHISETVSVNGHVLSRVPASEWHLARRATIIMEERGNKYSFNRDEFEALVTGLATPAYAGDAARLNMVADSWIGFLDNFVPNSRFVASTWSPYDVFVNGSWNSSGLNRLVTELIFGQSVPVGGNYHFATVIDPLPVELAGNLGVQLLPGCAWFEVEFLMPEDPRNSIRYVDPTAANPNNNVSKHWDMPRWTSIPAAQTYVFVPDSPENRAAIAQQVGPDGRATGRLSEFGRLDQKVDQAFRYDAVEQRVIRTWPYAIRITVRVFDPRGRLEEPIVRSIVHRFE